MRSMIVDWNMAQYITGRGEYNLRQIDPGIIWANKGYDYYNTQY